jgi:hypothetical protein
MHGKRRLSLSLQSTQSLTASATAIIFNHQMQLNKTNSFKFGLTGYNIKYA